MSRFFLALTGFLLIAAGGFAAGLQYAPIVKPNLIDLSAFSKELREQYRDKAYLDQVETQYEMGKVMLAEMEAETAALGLRELPADFPAFPFGMLHNAPDAAHWLDADLSGDTGEVAAAKAGWSVVNLWATWCAPCIAEMPDMQRAAEQLDGKITFLLINADASGKDTPEDVTTMYERRGVTRFAPLIAEDAEIDAALSAFGMARSGARYPANIIYAPGGEPWAIFYGGPIDDENAWSSPEMIAFLTALSELESAI